MKECLEWTELGLLAAIRFRERPECLQNTVQAGHRMLIRARVQACTVTRNGSAQVGVGQLAENRELLVWLRQRDGCVEEVNVSRAGR